MGKALESCEPADPAEALGHGPLLLRASVRLAGGAPAPLTSQRLPFPYPAGPFSGCICFGSGLAWLTSKPAQLTFVNDGHGELGLWLIPQLSGYSLALAAQPGPMPGISAEPCPLATPQSGLLGPSQSNPRLPHPLGALLVGSCPIPLPSLETVSLIQNSFSQCSH